MKFTTSTNTIFAVAITSLTTSPATMMADAFGINTNNNNNNKKKLSKTEQVEQGMSDRSRLSTPEIVAEANMAGNFGFDPLHFCQNTQDLELYREAEIRHARLAMLAAVGWPLAELYNSKIAAVVGEPALTDATNNELNPAVLNGNIGTVPPTFFVAALTLGAMIEANTFLRQKNGGDESTPEPKFIGDIGFDFLNLYPSNDDPEGQLAVQSGELNNGRIAMLAVTGYAIAEAFQNEGIVQSTPFFF